MAIVCRKANVRVVPAEVIGLGVVCDLRKAANMASPLPAMNSETS